MRFAGAPVIHLVHVEQEPAVRIDLCAGGADRFLEYPALPAAGGLPGDPFAGTVVETDLDGLRNDRAVSARHDRAAEGERPRLVRPGLRVLLAAGLALLPALLVDRVRIDSDRLSLLQLDARLGDDLRRLDRGEANVDW